MSAELKTAHRTDWSSPEEIRFKSSDFYFTLSSSLPLLLSLPPSLLPSLSFPIFPLPSFPTLSLSTFLSKDSLLSRERIAAKGPELDMLHTTCDKRPNGVWIELYVKDLERRDWSEYRRER